MQDANDLSGAMRIPLFRSLEQSTRVLVAGCGGAFDVVSGLPIYPWLRSRGKEVTLANLSVSELHLACEVTGVQPLRESYAAVVAWRNIDTIVLVDGGTDGLIKGDEASLAGSQISSQVDVAIGRRHARANKRDWTALPI